MSGPEYLSTTTDSEGGFSFEGLKPGRWSATIQLADGAECNTLDFAVPEVSADPVRVELVMARGRVSGTLCDGREDEPLSDDGARWFLALIDTETEESLSSVGNRRGSRFSFAGVPDGRYVLSVRARGFGALETEPFYLLGGQSVDLGRIALQPSGVLDIEVVDRLGGSVPAFSIVCGERKVQFWERQALSPGKCRCFSLPLGEVAITISARGFADRSARIVLEPGRVGALRVELDRE